MAEETEEQNTVLEESEDCICCKRIPGYIKMPQAVCFGSIGAFLFMDFSLLSPLEFFVVPKNGDGRNNEPPAMRVRVDCYTKKLPFRVQ